MKAFFGALLLCIGALLSPSAWAEPQFPKLTGRVVDDANILPPDVEQRLTQKLEGLEQQSRRQFVIATLPSLQGYEISDYGYQLGRAWGIGSKANNDGVLLIVAPNERKLRIEVGYGLEGVLPDGMGFLIINNDIVPRFKAGDMPGGVEAGADAIIKQLSLPPEQAQQIAAQSVQQSRQRNQGVPLGTIIFGLFILFFFILPILRAMFGHGGRRRGGFGAPIIWMPGGFGGGGGGWGGGGGGGGFSGGGGSFGGGGASGGW
ncbi:YgcG family protein [Novosphingobium sp. 9U]|uniref:TPM domain-containing protein n=1 Tax=Novosphingobium sp. 9U TaxID=2653158 RepID=UPI0012F18E68|nr:TPM domain-containing protein [Novosphingobium sp. 9U]VWX52177.1 Methanol dehydrogenase [Novosphingobium sp. 9U]